MASLKPYSIRRGFVVGALIGFGVVGTSLKAITLLPAFARAFPTVSEPIFSMPAPPPRIGIPSELAWFFVKFPYTSGSVQVSPRNHHTFRIMDSKRGKDY